MFRKLAIIVALAGVALAHPPAPIGTKGQQLIGPVDWPCPSDGVFPVDERCDMYYSCWNGLSDLWQCTELMLFDLAYDGCNFAAYVDCGDRFRPTNVPSTLKPTVPTTTSNVSTTTTEGPSEEFECPGDGVFAHEERCEYYWNCYAGIAELVHCQLDYLFDLTYMGCNFPDYTDCQNRTRPIGASTTIRVTITTPGPVETTTPPVTTTPAPTTVFTGPTTTPDPSAPSTEATTEASSTETTTTSSEKPGGDFECPVGVEGDFADPEDCSKYFTCTGGVAYHQSCPDGLWFDQTRDTCDFPANVDCQMKQRK